MLMPALAAGLRGKPGGGGDEGAGGDEGEVEDGDEGEVEDGDEGEVEDGDDDEGDDDTGDDDTVSAVVAIIEEAVVANDVGAVLLEPLSSDANSLRPYVCGWTASFDVILKRGVLA